MKLTRVRQLLVDLFLQAEVPEQPGKLSPVRHLVLQALHHPAQYQLLLESIVEACPGQTIRVDLSYSLGLLWTPATGRFTRVGAYWEHYPEFTTAVDDILEAYTDAPT